MVNLRQELIEGWWTIDRTNVRDKVDQTSASWNHLSLWLRRLASMRKAY